MVNKSIFKPFFLQLYFMKKTNNNQTTMSDTTPQTPSKAPPPPPISTRSTVKKKEEDFSKEGIAELLKKRGPSALSNFTKELRNLPYNGEDQDLSVAELNLNDNDKPISKKPAKNKKGKPKEGASRPGSSTSETSTGVGDPENQEGLMNPRNTAEDRDKGDERIDLVQNIIKGQEKDSDTQSILSGFNNSGNDELLRQIPGIAANIQEDKEFTVVIEKGRTFTSEQVDRFLKDLFSKIDGGTWKYDSIILPMTEIPTNYFDLFGYQPDGTLILDQETIKEDKLASEQLLKEKNEKINKMNSLSNPVPSGSGGSGATPRETQPAENSPPSKKQMNDHPIQKWIDVLNKGVILHPVVSGLSVVKITMKRLKLSEEQVFNELFQKRPSDLTEVLKIIYALKGLNTKLVDNFYAEPM
ncbi:MAG: hypothetical protein QKV30_gp2 [Apis rhabdovirus 3]|uniref:Uncharacterized protein n=1 Tax=Apis rhabdovirus 3 TaxID=2873557 RepID=A0A8K1J756_9RHAB|nr:MAG: hypothetical protein QKV30_gp2 [Apis rhabdovirus 3]UCR92527.1 MAG: hypothetical protein [Apis rhabdovirus 3]